MSYYTVIPASVRHDNSLSDGAKLLFGDLRGLGDKFGYCLATNEFLSGVCGVTARQIRNYLNELEAAGHITIDREDGRKIFTVSGKDISGGVEENCLKEAEENCHHTNTSSTNTSTMGEKRKRFVPPTVKDVVEYAADSKRPDLSEQFVDHFTATGWMMGNRQMKDWRAAYRNWCRNEAKFSKGRGAVAAGSLMTYAEMLSHAQKNGFVAGGNTHYEPVPQGAGKPLWRVK